MWWLLGIFFGVPALILGGAAISVTIEEAIKKKREAEHIQEQFKNLYNKILQSNYHDRLTGDQGQIKELPQLTFAKFLTFYNTNPENWDIEMCYTNVTKDKRFNHFLPTYYKQQKHIDKKGKISYIATVGIPIFWSDPEEMQKFEEWLKGDYAVGNVAGYQRERDAKTLKLAEMLQEDVKERQKKIQEDYARIVDSVVVPVPNSNIKLTLNQTEQQGGC